MTPRLICRLVVFMVLFLASCYLLYYGHLNQWVFVVSVIAEVAIAGTLVPLNKLD